MYKIVRTQKWLFIALAIAPLFSYAQIEKKTVKFPAGASSTVIKAVVKGDKMIDYLVGASAGQTITVSLKSTNTANYFNLMEPGEEYAAIYNSSIDGNTYTKVLEKSGDYTIRVYLVRAAARRNESGNFTLSIAISGTAGTGDAKVKGTKYHATGTLRAAMGDAEMGSTMADFGVVRTGNGTATVDIHPKGGLKRTLKFANGEWTCEGSKLSTKREGDEWIVTIDDYDHYTIPDAVIYGG